MSAAHPPVILVLGVMVMASLVAALAAALTFARPEAEARLGHGRAVALGLAASGAATFGLLLLLDPDPVAGPETLRDYAGRTLVSAGFCAMFWLPIFLSLRGLLRRGQA
jgi:hypothetical protein